MSENHGTAPFQFSLRRLLTIMAALAVLFAVMHQVGLLWSIAIAWLLLLAAAHVIANAWGTRARDSQRSASQEAIDLHQDAAEANLGNVRPVRFAPETRLRRATPLSRLMFVLTGGGALLGGIVGTAALVFASGEASGIGGIVVGGFSSTILGGILGFLTSTSVGVGYRAWREASSDASPGIQRVSAPPAQRSPDDSNAVAACPGE